MLDCSFQAWSEQERPWCICQPPCHLKHMARLYHGTGGFEGRERFPMEPLARPIGQSQHSYVVELGHTIWSRELTYHLKIAPDRLQGQERIWVPDFGKSSNLCVLVTVRHTKLSGKANWEAMYHKMGIVHLGLELNRPETTVICTKRRPRTLCP